MSSPDLKTQLDHWSTQLNTGLQARNVETCMEAIKKLKELGANVTFSLAPEGAPEQAAYPQPAQGDAGQYQGYAYPPQSS